MRRHNNVSRRRQCTREYWRVQPLNQKSVKLLQRGTNSFAERTLLSVVHTHGTPVLLQAFPKLQIGSCEKNG